MTYLGAYGIVCHVGETAHIVRIREWAKAFDLGNRD